MMNIQDTWVQVPGGQLFVRQWQPEASQALPLVLLHDSLGCVDLWRDFPEALAQATQRRVIAYDRLGFGQSSARQAPPTARFIEEEAEIYLPAVAEALCPEGYLLLGHSVGGGMALKSAGLHPQACKAVISESAQAFIEARTLQGIRDAKQGFQNPDQFARLTRWHGDKARWVLDAWTESWLMPGFADWSLDAWLPEVHCPVLVIHGDQDEFGSQAFPERIHQGVAGPSTLALLDACGHVPHKEKQPEVLRLIQDFIALHRLP